MTNEKVLFDKGKFKQVLNYIIFKAGARNNVGKTVLYKMMYFSDFDFYELNEKSITGEVYVKLEHGPGPSHFDSVVKELENEGKVKETSSTYCGFPQKKVIPVCEPELDKLNGEEIKVIDKVINRLASMSAIQVSEYSHKDLPWKATEKGKNIKYQLVFYRDKEYAVSQEAVVC